MNVTLANIALLLAIFLMMHAAVPLAILGLFISTGRPDVVSFLRKIREGMERD